ncbi:hypothetical protein PCE1_004139 [Barthelona sp. PCE]
MSDIEVDQIVFTDNESETEKNIDSEIEFNDNENDENEISIKSLEEKISTEIMEKAKAAVEAKNSEKNEESERSVVFLSRIPKYLNEPQLRSYFTQFGLVKSVRISRNRRTGAHKHFGWVEFQDRHDAEVAVEVMTNYLVHFNFLQAKLLEDSEIHEGLFKNAAKPFFHVNHRRKHREEINKKRTAEQIQKNWDKLLKKEAVKKQKLKDEGYEYEYPGYEALVPKE